MKKHSAYDIIKKIAVIGVVVVGVALIVSGAVMLTNHTSEILKRSQTQATIQSIEAKNKVEDKLDNYLNYVSIKIGEIEAAKDQEEVDTAILKIKNDPITEWGLKTIRYIDDGLLYGRKENGELFTVEKDLAIDYFNSPEKENKITRFLGINEDKMPEYGSKTDSYPVELYEFYASTDSSDYLDGVAFYFDKGIVNSRIGKDFRNTNSLMSTLVDENGSILIGDVIDGVPLLSKSTTKEMLNEFGIYDKDVVNEAMRLVNHNESGTILCKINGLNHVISVQANKEKLSDLCIFEIYECAVLAQSTNDLINAIVAIIIVFVVIILMTIGILAWNHYRMQIKINNAEKYDLKLDCLNRVGFQKEATDILSREKEAFYGVVVLSLRHFKYLNENFGESEANSLLQYIKLTLQKTCRIEEIYGHFGHGEFLILLHAKNREDLIDRLKIHSFLAKQYKGAHKFDVAIKYGIYERQIDEHTTVEKMVDYAIEANNAIVKATVENVDMQFNFYDDELRKIRLINEDMELRQDSALRDGEFQVFYQAKYNLKNKKQDGAEALVRWYDPKTGEYNKPALFMPLFESNGFIEKLDKYVYTKVCEYISYSLASGRKVFPISVNVSRITATQPDFVDFYAKTKKKYGISNGALTIEFTESFAYENYDVLKNIVNKLHDAGFKTSIDDFGCGYSSYRILKELPMDEIKLDKFFIDYSENPDRINSIFESVIALAKRLNMKVTQEGVEKPEDVELLKKLGCDVIQGYIYSHPLSLTDYLHFVENTKDHNL